MDAQGWRCACAATDPCCLLACVGCGKVKFPRIAFPQTFRHYFERSLTVPLKRIRAYLIGVLVALNLFVETLDRIE
jgi:hypothetical protein